MSRPERGRSDPREPGLSRPQRGRAGLHLRTASATSCRFRSHPSNKAAVWNLTNSQLDPTQSTIADATARRLRYEQRGSRRRIHLADLPDADNAVRRLKTPSGPISAFSFRPGEQRAPSRVVTSVARRNGRDRTRWFASTGGGADGGVLVMAFHSASGLLGGRPVRSPFPTNVVRVGPLDGIWRRCPFGVRGDVDQGTQLPGRIIRPSRLRPWSTATVLNGALRARLAQKGRRP